MNSSRRPLIILDSLFETWHLTALNLVLLMFWLASASLAQAAQPGLPTGWSDTDIGSPADAGSASDTNGLWTVSGGGAGIENNADQCNFVSESLPSDGSIVALVTSVQTTDASAGLAGAGVMFRNDTTPGSMDVCLMATAGQGVIFQTRPTTGGSGQLIQDAGITPPVWLKLNRSSDQYSGYYSFDGTNWVRVGATTTVELNGSVLAGLAVTANNNAALNTSTFTNVSIDSSTTFGIYRELWTNLDGNAVSPLAALTNTTENPNWPGSPVASYTHIFTNFESEINLPMFYFGQRLRTFVVPPMNGWYTFWIAADDFAQLYLSPDESAADMEPIATVLSATGSEDWTSTTNQQSAPIYLEAGCRYYLEARMVQLLGGENLSVRWQLPNETYEQPMTAISPSGTLLIPCDGEDTLPGVYSESTNETVVENQNVAFSLLVTNQGPVIYQWFADGIAIPGATQPVLTLSSASIVLNDDQVFSCVMSDGAGTVASAPFSVTVLPDTVPPEVTSVFSLGLTNVEIVFSKAISANASILANYVFANGLPIGSAVLGANATTVMLTTAPMVNGSNYVITINNLHDLASTPNYLTANTLASFTAAPFASQDIGSPGTASSVVYTTNGEAVTGAGDDIGGDADQFNFQYQLRSGNFDVSVCLAGLGLSDLWAQGGLMARASLDIYSPYAATLATPGMNGEFFSERTVTNGQAVTSGNFPVNYPSTWLRLNRVGNVFTGFGSYDGTNWAVLGTATLNLPAQVYLGLAAASHNTNQPTTAQFKDYETTPASAVTATTVNPHDAMGPTSRTTPIVFSEVMWKPAPRTDGKNLEFLEIYNSNPWFQDISGYQISCADVTYTFPAGTTIQGGAYLVVAAAPADMTSVYGITNVMGPYNGSLKHSETLELLDEQTNILLTAPYTDVYPWPVATDGTGHSLVLANPTYGEGDPRAWDISDVAGGSPGRLDPYTPSPLRNVVINEILPHSENPLVPQFIELYNHSTNEVDVSGCILTDDPTTNKFVIPAGTVIGPAGFASFTQSQFGFQMNGAGETLYFIKPDGSRVLDAVQLGAQANGVSYGRWPDGANDFYAFATNTPGTNNSPILIGDIVINELMYDPISENTGDQYIELYNKGTNTINLAGWQFTAGVTFTFPTVVMAPNSYLVVAENITNLLADHPNLTTANTVGNYSGKLSHSGELVMLSMPETLYVTNTILVEEDQVTYGTGGRWGEWSGAGGSSLELIDPRSNHRLAANWADSDETQKSSWTDVEATGVLDNGANYDPAIDYAQIGLLDAGECLVDNLEVDYNGTNCVSNGTFENGLGLSNWSIQGCMACSSLESTGYESSYSLHIRSSDRIWTGDNSCEVALANTNLQAGDTATLRFKARWLRGWPGVLMRLNGNWLEATATLPVPTDLGSPGLPNSTYVTNAGPAIYNVTHNPPVPAAGQAVVVTCNVSDPAGVQNLTLYYRLDPATNYTAVTMNDSGAVGDAVPRDGVFSATIPGQPASQVVAFYLGARGNLGAATRFPAIRSSDNEPPRECVVMFGDGNPGGSFTACHLWLTQTNLDRWAALGNLSRDWKNDCTFVNGNRVIYNIGGRYTGSPFHQIYDYPNGSLCNYEWQFSEDDVFLGATDYKKIHQPGDNPGSDLSLQRSQLAFTFYRALGEPWLYKRYMVVYVNGSRRGGLMEDTQVPNSDVVKEHYPNDSDGYLYKMQPWFEMAPFLTGEAIGFNNEAYCDLDPHTTTGGLNKVPRYRWNYEIRRSPDTDSDFTNVFSLVDAASSCGTSNYVANMEDMADMNNWMRVFACNHAAGDWDTFGTANGQNMYGYIGAAGTKYTLLMWDLETVFDDDVSWGPGQYLLTTSPDPNLQAIYANPTFLRMYWRALQELCNGPLNVANSAPLLSAKYNAFTDNGLSVENPAADIETYLSSAETSISAQLAAVNVSSFSASPTVTVSNNLAFVTGQAPVNVDSVQINGATYSVTWTSLTNWLITIPLTNGVNTLKITGTGDTGQPIAGDSNTVSVVYHGTNSSPAGQVVINEIMYNPVVPNAQYVELYNNSTNTTYNLSGWQIPGLDYTFPNGSIIGPSGFVVLAANNPAFAAAYGATNPVFDLFTGALQPPQNLSLIQPDATGTNSLTVAEVEYDSAPPWPADAAGSALQLIDPLLANWRVGNWESLPFSATPDATNDVLATLAPFPSLWINEVEPLNVTGITNSAGQHAPWVELYNPTTNAISLNGVYLADNYTNLLQWAFPGNTIINAGQFLVVFADGLTNLSTSNQLHASFDLPAGTGSVALTRLYNSQPQVLDYLNYEDISPNDTYGSVPDGQSFVRQELYTPTPGAANDGLSTPSASYIYYSAAASIYTQDFDSLPDPGAGSVNTANTVTIAGITYSLANPYDFAYPVVASGSTGGLDIAAMAGWYGSAAVESRFGATDGDQTTGGQISFGPASNSDRALGLIATSTTGATAFGARLINGTGITLDRINLQFTGEVWRQSNVPKTLQFFYYIDPTATAPFPTSATAYIPALNVNFPTVAADTGGVAVNGTSTVCQTNLVVLDQSITNWPPGTALWLVWQMTDSTGKAQGLGIDNLSFSASVPIAVPLSVQTSGTNLLVSWPAVAGQVYQLEYKDNLTSPLWTLLGNPVTGAGVPLTLTNNFSGSPQRYFRLQLVN